MILVVSHAKDDHAREVLGALERAGHPSALFDTAKYPSRASLSQHFDAGLHHNELVIDGHPIDLGACRAAWWRRPQPFTLQSGISPDAVSFAYTECHEAMAGLWATLDVEWVNPPGLDELAHHKPYQLAIAGKVGLPVPRTIITNDQDVARRFITELGPERTIYKTFLASEECWRETRIVRPEEMEMLHQVRLAPVIFQEYVPATADIRATVIGQQIFAAAISPNPKGYEVDYRIDLAGARFEPTELPYETTLKVHELMSELGLVYGAVDLRRTPEGSHVFLEVNPAGEWLFVEERTHQPITEALARLLADLDRRNAP